MRRLALLAVTPFAATVLGGCGSGGGTSAYCDSARTLQKDTANLGQVTATSSVDSLKALFATFAKDVDNLESNAPSDIKGDAGKVRTLTDSANSKVQGAKSLQDIGTALSGFTSNDKDTKAAGDHVDAFTKTNCGFTIGSSSTTSGASSGGGGSTATDSSGPPSSTTSSDSSSSSSTSSDSSSSTSSTSS